MFNGLELIDLSGTPASTFRILRYIMLLLLYVFSCIWHRVVVSSGLNSCCNKDSC